MKDLQTLTIAYECESSLGNSLNTKEMTKEFLKVFLKKTSALYALIVELKDGKYLSALNSVGKNEFFNIIINSRPEKIDKFKIIEIENRGILYDCLYLVLDEYCLAFVYSKKTQLDIKIIANIFSSLTQKIEISLKATKEHERIELALLGSNDGLWDWNLIDNSVYFSPRWKEMLGYTNEEIPNEFSSWEKRVHPSDLEDCLLDVQKNINSETEYFENVHRLKHKDGHWIWVLDRGKTYFDNDGKAIRMIGTHTNITNEKEMQLKFAHQAQIIEQIHDSVISTDLNGNIVSFNRGSELLFGYKSDAIIGKNILILHLEENYEVAKKSIALLNKDTDFNAEIQLMTKDKEIISVHMSISKLKDEKSDTIGLVCYAHDLTARKKIEDELRKQKDILHHQANHDSLTKLPNRAFFQDYLEQSIDKAKVNETTIALFFIDLDHFKEINDSLGHDVGDEVLKIVTMRLRNIIRKEDRLSRLGGDEFTIIIDSLINAQSVSVLAEKILHILKEPIHVNSQTLYVTSSIGISLYPQDAKTYNNLLKYADIAMYKAKDNGRNNFKFYSPKTTK